MERVADYIIRKINEAGAGHIFLITGRGILYLTDAVAKNQNIVSVSTFHEQGASYAAMAYASSHEGVSACLVSTGCAATNAVTAALCAYQDNLPVVFISGNNQLDENTRHTRSKIRTYGSQEADIISVVDTVTKYAVMIEDVQTVVYEVEKALYIAMEGRKGPVWIDVPLDIQNMRIEESEMEHYVPEACSTFDLSDDISMVAQDLGNAQRPILLIGGGTVGATNEIRKFVERYNIPLVFSPSAADIYGSANELSIGAVGSLGGSRAGNIAIQNSDYLLAIGTKLCSQLTGKKERFAREAKIIVVDIDPIEHTKESVHIDNVIISDAKAFIGELIESNPSIRCHEWTQRCIHWKERFSVNKEDFVIELKKNNQIDLYSLMDELSGNLPDDATVITDAGLEELIVPSTVRFGRGQRCLFPAAQGAMGYAIPAIIGAYTAGRKNIVCIVGDGSIMMNVQELRIISAMQIPVKILVINNGMYAVIRKRQTDLFRKRTIGNDPSDGVPQPDFRAIADCFGLQYERIEDRDSLLSDLPRLITEKKQESKLIEIMCVQDQKYFHESYTLNERKRLVHRPIEDMSPFLPREIMKEEMIIDMMEE